MDDLLIHRFEPNLRRRNQKSSGFTIDGVQFQLQDLNAEQVAAWSSWTEGRTNAEVARFLEIVRDNGDDAALKEAESLIDELEASDSNEAEVRERGETLLTRLRAGDVARRIFTRIVSDYIESKTGLPH